MVLRPYFIINRFRYLFTALLLLTSFSSLQAQNPAKKKDTLIITNSNIAKSTGTPLLANNLPGKNGMYNHVPLAGERSYFGEKNEYVNDFVRKYLELHYNTLGSVQNKSLEPFSIIDNELEKKNMPRELKYLAVIESALNHNAVSRAGAVGPWQLMETTARMMGLSVSRKVDERRDLVKSTLAATKYLELLYSQLNDWLLVIAAYNSGPTPVQRAIDRTGSHNFWDIKEFLPRETQGHVLAFIATASIFENLSKFISLGSIPVDFKFGKEEEPAPLVPAAVANSNAKPGNFVAVKKPPYSDEELKNMAIVRITEPLLLDLVAQEIGADKKALARWNVDYEMFVYNSYPTPFYNLRIPKEKLDIFLQKKDQLGKKSKVYFSANK
jgi:membrane-bound lytic murein transglycosylase D